MPFLETTGRLYAGKASYITRNGKESNSRKTTSAPSYKSVDSRQDEPAQGGRSAYKDHGVVMQLIARLMDDDAQHFNRN